MEVIECMEGSVVDKAPNGIDKKDVRVKWFTSPKLMTLAENADAGKKHRLEAKKNKFKEQTETPAPTEN
jgi:hypothetical protein